MSLCLFSSNTLGDIETAKSVSQDITIQMNKTITLWRDLLDIRFLGGSSISSSSSKKSSIPSAASESDSKVTLLSCLFIGLEACIQKTS